MLPTFSHLNLWRVEGDYATWYLTWHGVHFSGRWHNGVIDGIMLHASDDSGAALWMDNFEIV